MKYAYVTLVMLGDKYVPGAIALAKSLISSGTDYDKVCLITSDVTLKRDLERVYDRVVRVPFLHHECGSMLTQRQADLYADWIDYSFTKWRCLELVEYSKCVYLDADQIVLRNIDHLFNLNTPAMCFNHNYCSHFKHIKYGHRVKDLPFVFHNYSVLGFTGTLVFKPCPLLFRKIKHLLSPNNAHLKNNKFNNGFEEVVFAQAMVALGIEPTQLSPMYLWNAGDYYVLKNTQPYVINYYGDKKPWLADEERKFMDEYIWWWFYSSWYYLQLNLDEYKMKLDLCNYSNYPAEGLKPRHRIKLFKQVETNFWKNIGVEPNYNTNIFISFGHNGRTVFKSYESGPGGKPPLNTRFKFTFDDYKLPHEEDRIEVRAYSCTDRIVLMSKEENFEKYIEDGEMFGYSWRFGKMQTDYFRWYMTPSKLPSNFELIITDSRCNAWLKENVSFLKNNTITPIITDGSFDDESNFVLHISDPLLYWDTQ